MNIFSDLRKFLFIVLTFLAFTALPARAQSPGHFTLGYGISNFEYTEPKMTESGTLQHLQAKYEKFKEHHYIGMDGNLWAGNLKYDGETLEENPRPVTTETDDFILTTNLRVGTPQPRKSGVLIPYLGLGYRYWNNVITESNITARTERTTQYFYSPLGFLLASNSARFGKTILKMEYLYFWAGKVTTQFGNAPELNNDQNQGKGGRIALTFLLGGQQKISHSLSIFFNYWDIEPSESDSILVDIDNDSTKENVAFYEPANSTAIIGAQLNITF